MIPAVMTAACEPVVAEIAARATTARESPRVVMVMVMVMGNDDDDAR